MTPEIKARLNWVTLYEEIDNAGIVCRRCGISRPTLRKWWKRYLTSGVSGLEDHSRRPHSSPNKKVTVKEEQQILRLRIKRNLRARRIQWTSMISKVGKTEIFPNLPGALRRFCFSSFQDFALF